MVERVDYSVNPTTEPLCIEKRLVHNPVFVLLLFLSIKSNRLVIKNKIIKKKLQEKTSISSFTVPNRLVFMMI